MKKTVLSSLFCAATLVLLAAGCGNASQQKDAEGFPPAETLVADSVAIDQLLQPQNCAVCGDYAVVISPQSSKVVWRYRLPQWTFVDSSFVQGGGPDDLGQYVAVLKTNDAKNSAFWLSDLMRRRLLRFDPSGETLVKTAERRYAAGSQGMLLGDTLLVSVFYRQNEYSSLRTADFGDSLVVKDSVAGYSISKMSVQQSNGKIQSVSVRSFNTATLAACGDRLAVWYPGTKNLQVLRVGAGGTLAQEGVYGENPLDEKAVEAYVDSAAEPGSGSEDALTLLAADAQGLYFLDKTFESDGEQPVEGQLPKGKTLALKVYDWEWKPVAKYELDHPSAIRVLVDTERGKIYAYDPSLDFEQVYVYSLK